MATRPRPRRNGFTLVELVVVLVIVAALAAVAVPRFIQLGATARVAALKTLAGALQTATANVHAACATSPQCSYQSYSQAVTIGGRTANVNYGWLEAGDNLGLNQIDAWVDHSGFTASLPQSTMTKFSLDGAPDPGTCAVTYEQAVVGLPDVPPRVVVLSSGC